MIRLPEDIAKQMPLYREGVIPLPVDYINFHATCAEVDLNRRLYTEGSMILLEDRGMQSDGWCDGMKVRTVVVAENQKHGQSAPGAWRVLTLRWHESGAWFAQGAGGGWVREIEADPETPRTARLAMPPLKGLPDPTTI